MVPVCTADSESAYDAAVAWCCCRVCRWVVRAPLLLVATSQLVRAVCLSPLTHEPTLAFWCWCWC